MTKVFEKKLAKSREFKAQGAVLLWERMTIYVELERDEEFVDWVRNVEGTNEYDFFDDELAETGYDYYTLRGVLNVFPDKERWGSSLGDLIASVLDAQKSARKSDEEKESTRKSWKSIAEERQKKIEKLEHELAVSSGRIDELEKVVRLMREPAAA